MSVKGFKIEKVKIKKSWELFLMEAVEFQHREFLRMRWMNILRRTQIQLILALDSGDWVIFCNALNLTVEVSKDWIWVSKSVRNIFQPTAVRDRTLAVHRPNRKEEMNLFCNTGEDYYFFAHIRAVP